MQSLIQVDIDKAIQFLNGDRLRVYPRLFFIATWSIFLVNILFHSGWMGGLGQIIGIDYLLFYSTGSIYRREPTDIYDFEAQSNIQRNLISPTELPAVNPYFNPPYVALPHSWLTYIPYTSSFLIWSIISIALVIISAKILFPHLPVSIKNSGFTINQMIIVMFSFFPFMEGFQAGQNHTLTLLLISLVIAFSLYDRWYLAGIAAGFLLYKPQFILGFLIVWLFGRKFKAILSFSIIAAIWVGYFIIRNGISLFNDYLIVSSMLLNLPYDDGFPTYLLATPYGLLASILPQSSWIFVYRLTQAIMIIASVLIARQAWRARNLTGGKIMNLYAAAILLPLLATPYALLHDLLILIPFFVMLSNLYTSKKLILVLAAVYTGGLLLPLIGYVFNLALPALITIGIAIIYLTTIQFLQHQIT